MKPTKNQWTVVNNALEFCNGYRESAIKRFAELQEQIDCALATLKKVQPYIETGESEGDEGAKLAPIVRDAISRLNKTNTP